MVGKNRSIMSNAVIIGVLTAVSSAILFILVLQNLWWNLQESFGHAMFHRLEDIVMGAEYMQGLSLLIVLPLMAGALTAYFSRATIESDKAAARAGAFAGLVIACAFCLAATGLFVFVGADRPDFNLWYLVDNASRVLIVSLVVPAIAAMPPGAVGAIVLRRNLSNAEGVAPRDTSRGNDLLIATAAAIVLAGSIAALISRSYDISPVIPALYSIPLLLTLPLLAAGMNMPYKKGSMPVVIVILGLSIIAIVVLPLAGTWLACQTRVIYAEPYDWENLPVPDVFMRVVQNVSGPVEELARNLSQKSGFDWGMSWYVQGDDANSGIVEYVNASTCDMGVITRELKPDETALGINQTIIASDGAENDIVFITKGERPANVTRFIDFAFSEEGRAILASDGYTPA